MATLVERLRDEADQCRNDGADDIAKLLDEAGAEIESLLDALRWYADGEHFGRAEADAWDTVSGEPQNWWCDEAGTAMVEDGTLARMVLDGKMTGQQLQAMDDENEESPEGLKGGE